jgi:stearoyl-CoA desaturase (delta-9 desaturase)
VERKAERSGFVYSAARTKSGFFGAWRVRFPRTHGRIRPIEVRAARLDWVTTSFIAFVHVVAIAGTILYAILHGFTVAALAIMLVWLVASGFSITGGYHRLFAHGSYRAHPLVRAFFLFFGSAAVQNSALKWASDHRRHHRRVDTDDDPYNIRRGFWWAHIGWVLIKSPSDTSCVGDLERDPLVRIQHRFYIPLAVLAGFALPFAVGWLFGDPWGGLVLGGFVRLVLQYHATFCVNSVAHTFGRQTYTDRDSSRDSFVTAMLTLGEGYHNFHHAFPFDYRNGIRGWHFDPTKWLIRGLSWSGLTAELVRAPRQVVLKARLRMQQRQAGGEAALITAARENVEALLDRWAQIREEWRQAGRRSRREVREAWLHFRAAYKAWKRTLASASAPSA